MDDNQNKSKLATLLLCFFLGGFGAHRFYLGKIGTGILWLLTCGFCGIGAVVDFFKICFNKITDKNGNTLNKDISDEACKIFAIVVGVIFAASILSFISVIAMTMFMFANITSDFAEAGVTLPDVKEIVELYQTDMYSEIESEFESNLEDMDILVD